MAAFDIDLRNVGINFNISLFPDASTGIVYKGILKYWSGVAWVECPSSRMKFFDGTTWTIIPDTNFKIYTEDSWYPIRRNG